MNHQSIDLNETIFANLLQGWQDKFTSIKHSYATNTHTSDEVLLTISQNQVNQALHEFVVKNVGLLLDLKLGFFDDYLTLSCTANFLGLHFSVSSDFRLIQIRADKYIQRVVLEQISDTKVIELYSKSWWKAPAIKYALNAYRTFLKKDPLPFLLSLSPKLKGKPFIEYKGNFIYLEIGRWLNSEIQLKKFLPKDSIKNYFKRIQVNNAQTKHEQLLLKIQPNFGEILSFGDPNADIITEKDNPNKAKIVP